MAASLNARIYSLPKAPVLVGPALKNQKAVIFALFFVYYGVKKTENNGLLQIFCISGPQVFAR